MVCDQNKIAAPHAWSGDGVGVLWSGSTGNDSRITACQCIKPLHKMCVDCIDSTRKKSWRDAMDHLLLHTHALLHFWPGHGWLMRGRR